MLTEKLFKLRRTAKQQYVNHSLSVTLTSYHGTQRICTDLIASKSDVLQSLSMTDLNRFETWYCVFSHYQFLFTDSVVYRREEQHELPLG